MPASVTTVRVPPGVAAGWSEAEFTAWVIGFAQAHGWKAAHFRPAKTAKGWRTAVQGDGKGFPDLVMVRPHPFGGAEVVVAELKVGRNKATADQLAWLDLFRRADVAARLWTPADLPEIQKTLAGGG